VNKDFSIVVGGINCSVVEAK